MSSKIKVDTIETVAGSGNITLSNALVANSGVSIDNITIDGTEIDLSSGDLTLDVAGEIVFDETKPDGNPRKLLDSSKFTNFGWKPSIDLSEGLKITYDWFLKNIA